MDAGKHEKPVNVIPHKIRGRKNAVYPMIKWTRSSLARKGNLFTTVINLGLFHIFGQNLCRKSLKIYEGSLCICQEIRGFDINGRSENCHLLLLRHKSGTGAAGTIKPWVKLWIMWCALAWFKAFALRTTPKNEQKTFVWPMAVSDTKISQKALITQKKQEKERV